MFCEESYSAFPTCFRYILIVIVILNQLNIKKIKSTKTILKKIITKTNHVEPLFIGKVVWSPKHIGTSTLFFLYFEFILKKNNINVDSTRKISDCKINALKVERVQNTFENLNSLEIMLKMLKRWKYIKNAFFLGFSLFFSIFGFFSNIYQILGQKLGSNTKHKKSI